MSAALRTAERADLSRKAVASREANKAAAERRGKEDSIMTIRKRSIGLGIVCLIIAGGVLWVQNAPLLPQFSFLKKGIIDDCPSEIDDAVLGETSKMWLDGKLETPQQIAAIQTWAETVLDPCARVAWRKWLGYRMKTAVLVERSEAYRKSHPLELPPSGVSQ